MEKAIDRAINECIDEKVLDRFFRTRRDEIKKTAEWDFSLERQIQAIRKDEYDDGYEAGEKKGYTNGKAEGKTEGRSIVLIQMVQKKMKKGKKLPEIAEELEIGEDEVKPYYDALLAKGLDCDAEEILG